MAGISYFAAISCVSFFAVVVLQKWFFARKAAPGSLPPGPKGLPLLGNVNDLPPPEMPEYQFWLSHKEEYGSLSSVTVLGQTMIIMHDKAVAFELMEKRASRYSGRPKMKFVDLCGWGNAMATIPYGPTHRLYRKYAYQQIGTKAAVSKYYKLQEVAVGRFLSRIKRDKGANLIQHLNTEAAEVILDIVYGYKVEPHDSDPLVEGVNQAMSHFSAAAVPGKWMVDMLPFLERLPDWVPGTGFKRTARLWKQTLFEIVDIPYKLVESKVLGHGHASFVSDSIDKARQEGDFGPENEYAIKWSAGSMYTGGADTSVSTMAAFFLAMSIFPEVQRKAREEIERVVGSGRLPTFSDRENLPYINAIVEEAQRWHPIAPMGLSHAVEEEDIVNGFRIPKAAILLPAVWAFTRDPSVYHDPEHFKPERFLEPYNEPFATSFTFGFGRRICPGRVLADSSLFLTLAQSLAVFKVHKAVEGDGKVVEPEHTFGGGIVSHPGRFEVSVVPLSQDHTTLVDKVVQEHPWEDSDAKHIREFSERMTSR